MIWPKFWSKTGRCPSDASRTCAPRSRGPSRMRTRRASFIATSSRRTSSSPKVVTARRPRCLISGWPSSSREPSKRRSRAAARSLARHTTCRPSRFRDKSSTGEATSMQLAQSCTSASSGSRRSRHRTRSASSRSTCPRSPYVLPPGLRCRCRPKPTRSSCGASKKIPSAVTKPPRRSGKP